MNQGIPSPFVPGGQQRPPNIQVVIPPANVNKTLDIKINRPLGTGGFIEQMARITLLIIGITASVLVYEMDGIAAIFASAALIAWNIACVDGIIEHSKRNEVEKISKKDNEEINNAIEQFKKQ